MRTASTLALFLLTVTPATAAEPPCYRIVVLPEIVGPANYHYADINEAGVAIGDSLGNEEPCCGNRVRAVRWDARLGLTDLGALVGGGVSHAGAINTAGVVILRRGNATYRLDGRTIFELPTLGAEAGAYGINDTGIIVGASDGRPVQWIGDAIIPLSGPTVVGGALDISACGTVIVGGADDRPAVWEKGTLSHLGDGSGRAWAVDDAGTVIVGFMRLRPGMPQHAVRWIKDRRTGAWGLEKLDPGAPDVRSRAYDVNAHGDIVGFVGFSSHGDGAILWRDGELFRLNDICADSGWDVTMASAINDRGQIIAAGYRADLGDRRLRLDPVLTCPDLTGDGFVDEADVNTLLSQWGTCPSCFEDFDGDDAIDIGDLLLVLSAWGRLPVARQRIRMHMTNDKYSTAPPADLLPAWRAVFARQKAFAEHAFAQLDDDAFFRAPADGLNSVAIIAQHLAGNLRSRFTDFLTTDGEKPWRDREAEFAPPPPTAESRAALMAAWEDGWRTFFATLDGLTADDLARTVTIRNVPHAVHAALARALDHYAFHVGQINVIARLHVGSATWSWFTLAPGATQAFNENLMGGS